MKLVQQLPDTVLVRNGITGGTIELGPTESTQHLKSMLRARVALFLNSQEQFIVVPSVGSGDFARSDIGDAVFLTSIRTNYLDYGENVFVHRLYRPVAEALEKYASHYSPRQ